MVTIEIRDIVRNAAFLQELLMSYNIAIDRTAEQSQRLRSTADRVGLQLPKVYQDDPLNQ